MPRKLFLFPFGGNAREALLSVLAINRISREWEVSGFIDDNSLKHGQQCCGVMVVGGRELLRAFPDAMLLAVPGSPQNYGSRDEIITSLGIEPERFATIVHPSVCLSPDAKIGCNTIIMANAVISCGVSIGNHCVILPNTVVSHDSVVGDYCCLGSNISVSGSVEIAEKCYIGSGSRMREHIRIGAATMVGLGSNVVSDLPAGVIAVGNPAKVANKTYTTAKNHLCTTACNVFSVQNPQ